MGSSNWIVAALAFGTLGVVIVFAVLHLGRLMKRPEQRETAKNIATGGRSASQSVHDEAPDGSYHDRPLKERLDGSQASAHPADPVIKHRPRSQRAD